MDFQELISAVVNWPNSELYVPTGLLSVQHAIVWLVCYNPTLQCFPDCGVWGTVDLIQNTRFYGGETWAHGLPIQEEEKSLEQESTKLFQYLHPL